MKENTVLLVTRSAHRQELQALLEACGIRVLVAAGCKEVRGILTKRPRLYAVLTDVSLEDGSWWTIRNELVRQGVEAGLVVCLPRADGGVTDILEAGCSAVLVPPYEDDKVLLTIERATARSRRRLAR